MCSSDVHVSLSKTIAYFFNSTAILLLSLVSLIYLFRSFLFEIFVTKETFYQRFPKLIQIAAMSEKQQPPCQTEACRLQDCLWRNDFQEARCQGVLKDLRECCRVLLESGGSSRCCPSKKPPAKKSSDPASGK